MTERQSDSRRAYQDEIRETADLLRARSRQEQVEARDGKRWVFPLERYQVVTLLDELALAAGRGELPTAVRRATLEACRGLRAELARTADQGSSSRRRS